MRTTFLQAVFQEGFRHKLLNSQVRERGKDVQGFGVNQNFVMWFKYLKILE